MRVAFTAVAGVVGLVFGSFLTVVVHRVPRHESVVAPRSRCPVCGTEIRASDNIPVIGWLLLRGRCRACGEPISPRYPLMELLTGALFAGAAWHFGPRFAAGLVAALFAVLVAVSAIDLERKVIPNRIVYPSLVAFAVIVVLGWLAGVDIDPIRGLIGLVAFGLPIALVVLISPRGMGMGDAKLAALIGLVLGSLGLSYVAVAAGAAILAGGLGAIVAVVFFGAGRKTAIPFGPYLAAGAVVAAFVAPRVAAWYTALPGR